MGFTVQPNRGAAPLPFRRHRLVNTLAPAEPKNIGKGHGTCAKHREGKCYDYGVSARGRVTNREGINLQVISEQGDITAGGQISHGVYTKKRAEAYREEHG